MRQGKSLPHFFFVILSWNRLNGRNREIAGPMRNQKQIVVAIT
jgi:hypothetical protein